MRRFRWPRFKEIVGSLLAVLIGWLSGVLVFAGFGIHSGLLNAQEIALDFLGLGIVFLYMGAYIIPVWLVILLPVYTFLSADSPFWRPTYCTVLGVAAGAAIISIFPVARWSSPDWIVYFIMAAVVGGISCCIASLTVHYFRETQGV